MVGLADLVIVTSSKLAAQGALAIVHRKVFAPIPKPVKPDVGLFGEVIVPEPLISVHVPIPTVALLLARDAVATQTD